LQAAEVNSSPAKSTVKNTKTVPTPPTAPAEAPKEAVLELPISFKLDKNEVDRVIAVVSREVITAKDLKDRTDLVVKQLNEAKRPLPPSDILVRQVLEKLIEESVIYQEASYSNFKISDIEYEAIYNKCAETKKYVRERI
jgi:peptidyl-prolyl cis-trans isomerase SurA